MFVALPYVYLFSFLSKLGNVMIDVGIEIEHAFEDYLWIEEFGLAFAWYGAKLQQISDWMLQLP